MKKLSALLFAFLMILSLAACGGGNGTPDTSGGNTTDPGTSQQQEQPSSKAEEKQDDNEELITKGDGMLIQNSVLDYDEDKQYGIASVYFCDATEEHKHFSFAEGEFSAAEYGFSMNSGLEVTDVVIKSNNIKVYFKATRTEYDALDDVIIVLNYAPKSDKPITDASGYVLEPFRVEIPYTNWSLFK